MEQQEAKEAAEQQEVVDEEKDMDNDFFANTDEEGNGSVSERSDSKGEKKVSEQKEVSMNITVSDKEEPLALKVSKL